MDRKALYFAVAILESDMKIKNNTSFEVIAFGWYKAMGPRSYGADVHILPGEIVEVHGPDFTDGQDVTCQVELTGTITCHEAPDDEHGFLLAEGIVLTAGGFCRGITVRHYLDAQPERYATEWRRLAPV